MKHSINGSCEKDARYNLEEQFPDLSLRGVILVKAVKTIKV